MCGSATESVRLMLRTGAGRGLPDLFRICLNRGAVPEKMGSDIKPPGFPGSVSLFGLYLSLFDFSQLRLINVLPEQAVLDKDTFCMKQAGEEVSL